MQFTEGAATPPTPTTTHGVVLDGRVIMVETGEVVGIFTIREIHPYPDSFSAASTDPAQQAALQNMTAEQLQALLTQLQSGYEQMWSTLAKKLVDVLKGNPISPSRITKTAYVRPASTW